MNVINKSVKEIATFKSLFFTAGLVSGVFLGIKLRKKGLTSSASRLYHISQEDDFSTTKNILKPHATIDEIYEHFDYGLLQDKEKFEKFKTITYSHRYNQEEMDDLITRDPLKELKQNKYAHYRSNFNAYEYKNLSEKNKIPKTNADILNEVRMR